MELPIDRPMTGEIVLAERYQIHPDSPVPELDLLGATAFDATDLKNPTRQLFARICEPGVIPRVETMVQFKNMGDVRIMHALEWGPVFWTPENRRGFSVFFDRPMGNPLMQSLNEQIEPFKLETIVNGVIKSAWDTLGAFSRRNQVHRAIRPDNMYASGADNTWIQFGDCVTVPPGWGQSPILETIEMGMTPMSGRGPGTIADDMYALGATTLFLALGYCPVAHLPAQQVVEAKATVGSFAALLGDERPPLGLRELLRGLLCDDPMERWTVEDLEEFLEGEQRRSVPIAKESRADRGFEFEDVSIRQNRILAQAFGDQPEAARAAITSPEFLKWVNRNLVDTDSETPMSEVITELLENTADKNDKFLPTRICQVLDPLGPMRFQGLVMFPDGVSAMLAEAVRTKNIADIQRIAECIDSGVSLDWAQNREDNLFVDQTATKKNIKRVQQLLKITTPGYGIERCLYDLNSFAPCMSPILDKAYVYSLRDLMPALEAVVREAGELPGLMDRHVVAFIAARSKGQLDMKLKPLEEEDGKSLGAKLAMLYLFAYVQREYGPEMLPHLTKWLAEQLKPTLDLFKGRSLREELTRKLDAVVATGKISRLYAHLNHPATVKKDRAAFTAAQRELAETTSKIAHLESERFFNKARRSGWRIASAISSCIAVFTIGVLFLT
jgi:hypothetical protein